MTLPANARIPRRAFFIAIEGVDGSGKSTQARLLAEWCQARQLPVVLTREPGGTRLGERLRTLIIDAELTCGPRAELLMIEAARAQHVSEVISPALASGALVISDRFSLSTLAYQGFGRGLPLIEIRTADLLATSGCRPDLTLLIDVPVETVMSRLGAKRDRFEGEGEKFLQRVIGGYRQLSSEDPTVRIINGSGTIEQVQLAMRKALGQAI